MYGVRFWNNKGECIRVGGKYMHEFDTWTDAWEGANALLVNAYKHGAISMDISDEKGRSTWYPIEED